MLWRSGPIQLRTRPLHRLRLRRAAHRYAAQGWDVVPGACLVGNRFHCGDPGCPTASCHPAVPDWEEAASHNPYRIAVWWQRWHHTVLLATGRTFDVLELSAAPGRTLVNEVHGPIAVAPPGRWMFLVRPSECLRPELAGHPSVVLHRGGSWIPAPPTRLPSGRVRWEVAPNQCDWQLPDPYAVQQVAVRLLAALDRQPRTVWNQLNRAA
jgi:hypothetical protein